MIVNGFHERSAHQAMVREVGVEIAARQLQFWELQLIEPLVTCRSQRID
jgi:hypothetical protein